jgi:hypothetical protein
MRFRAYKVSEVGFGLWTVSTGWWGNFTEGEAIALMHKAFDLGITLFDTADTYGNGLSEELIAEAFPNQRDEIVIATKVGYDFVHYGQARGRGIAWGAQVAQALESGSQPDRARQRPITVPQQPAPRGPEHRDGGHRDHDLERQAILRRHSKRSDLAAGDRDPAGRYRRQSGHGS